jgi:DNA-binding response OmpR family regulator
MKRILLVDDEVNLAAGIRTLLEAEGFDVALATNVAETEAHVSVESSINTMTDAAHSEASPDLILLDWSLPDGQGIDLLRKWRAAGIQTPVVMLTARAQLIDRVLGLEIGADDYVTKPFEPRELVARIRARLRAQTQTCRTSPESTAPSAAHLRVADFQMDLVTRTLVFRGASVELTRMEWGLLRIFLENPRRVFSREELLDSVWGLENYPTTRTVDNHVLQLRQTFGGYWFETVRGVGYRFQPTPATGSRNDRMLTVSSGSRDNHAKHSCDVEPSDNEGRRQ